MLANAPNSRRGAFPLFGNWRRMDHLLYFLLIGLVAGWLAGKFIKGQGFGLVGNLIVGVLGALLGGFLFRVIGFTTYGLLADIIVAFVGALLLLYLIPFIKKG